MNYENDETGLLSFKGMIGLMFLYVGALFLIVSFMTMPEWVRWLFRSVFIVGIIITMLSLTKWDRYSVHICIVIVIIALLFALIPKVDQTSVGIQTRHFDWRDDSDYYEWQDNDIGIRADTYTDIITDGMLYIYSIEDSNGSVLQFGDFPVRGKSDSFEEMYDYWVWGYGDIELNDEFTNGTYIIYAYLDFGSDHSEPMGKEFRIEGEYILEVY